MSILKKYGPQIRTRLLQEHAERVRHLARVRRQSESSIVREAILLYFKYLDGKEQIEVESVYAHQTKVSTNRTCSFLARIAADVRAIYCTIGEEDPDRIKKWRASAFRQISERLNKEEAELAQRLSNVLGDQRQLELQFDDN